MRALRRAVCCLSWLLAAACAGDGPSPIVAEADAGVKAPELDGHGSDLAPDVPGPRLPEDTRAPALDAEPVDVPQPLDGGSDAHSSDLPPLAEDATAPEVFDPGPSPCAEVEAFTPVYDADLAKYTALGAAPPGGVVFAGSSSIRRWEGLYEAFSDYAPVQRGLGGLQLGELALRADALITVHQPRGVVVFSGTNDLAFAVEPAVVLDRLRCLRWRVGEALGWELPLFFIAVTPNPARWAQWPVVSEFNAAASALTAGDPGLHFIDVATPFLATGEPPDASLFEPDGLHLSPSGYALWQSAIRPAVAAVLSPASPSTTAPALPVGTRLLVDVGPSNPEDGELTPSPDYRGNHWNNWLPVEGGDSILAGEVLRDLVTTTGAPTPVSLVISGGFLCNGRKNGGLLWPDAAKLGDFAVGSATGDFFYVQNADAPGALVLSGLSPAQTYTVRLFAARDDSEVRATRYDVQGKTALLQTSGPGAGAGNTNDDTVAAVEGVAPDAWGNVFIDVSSEQGAFAYLSALELVAEAAPSP